VTAKVSATAVRKGDAISIKAEVKNADTAPKARLRVVLTEDWVRYKGGNGIRYHRNVVRAMPGGADGFGGDPKGFEKDYTIDLAKLRTDLAKSLDDFATKNDVTFPSAQRPMRLEDLHVVRVPAERRHGRGARDDARAGPRREVNPQTMPPSPRTS